MNWHRTGLFLLALCAMGAEVVVLPAPGGRTAVMVDVASLLPVSTASVDEGAFHALSTGSKTYVVSPRGVAPWGGATIEVEGGVTEAAVSGNGRRLAVVSAADPTLTLIHTATDRVMTRLALPSPARNVSINHASTVAIVGMAGAVGFVDLKTNRYLETVRVEKATSAVFTPGGDILVMAGETLVMLDAATRTVVAKVTGQSEFGTPQFTANGSHAVMLAKDGVWIAGLTPLRLAGPYAAAVDQVRVISERSAIGYSPTAQAFFRIELQPQVTVKLLAELEGEGVAGLASTLEDPESRFLLVATRRELRRSDGRGRGTARLTLEHAAGAVIALPAVSRAPVSRYSVVEGRRGWGLPVVARALDAEGVPVTSRTVEFVTACGDAGGVWRGVTNGQGYVSTGIRFPVGCRGLSIGGWLLGDPGFTEFLNDASPPEATGLEAMGAATLLWETGTEPPLLRLRSIARRGSSEPARPMPVTWVFVQGGGFLTPGTAADLRGIHTNRFEPYPLNGAAQSSAVIEARGTVGASLRFRVVALSGPPRITRLSPSIRASAGATVPAALRYLVTDANGGPVSGVGISFAGVDDYDPARCMNDAVTDASGLLSCDLFVGPGARTARVAIGGREVEKLPVEVLPGAPMWLYPQSGFHYSLRANAVGTTDILAAVVKDKYGNPVNGASVTWWGATRLADRSARGQYREGDGMVESDGLVFARLLKPTDEARVGLGRYDDASPFLPAMPAAFEPLDGSGQVAGPGQWFARPLSVELTSAGWRNPKIFNVEVEFRADVGLELSAATAVTDSEGRAEVMAKAGTAPGTYTVTATFNGASVRFPLVVKP